MSKLSLTVAMPDYDHARDLVTGRVAAEGIDLTCLVLPVEEIFYRFIVHKEWDVSEISMAKYCSLAAAGDKSFLSLPVFPSRVFRHGSLYVRRNGPVKTVKDSPARRARLAAVLGRRVRPGLGAGPVAFHGHGPDPVRHRW